MKIPKTSLAYHLNYLKKRDLIDIKYENKYKRHYISQNYGSKDKKYLGMLRNPITKDIILFLCFYDTLSQRRIVEYLKNYSHLDRHRTTVSFHLNKLEKIGIIESFSYGNEMIYMLNLYEWAIFIDLFIIHEKSFFDYKKVSNVLIGANDFPKDYFDRFIEKLWEIFPHPYHA